MSGEQITLDTLGGRRLRVAVTGGIGAGKSVVSTVLTTMGWPVYDCDSRAKMLMDSDREILHSISEQIGSKYIGADGRLDRVRLGARVFADADALLCLNGIVHRAVRVDLEGWFANRQSPISFVETAIPYSSGLDRMVDLICKVDAPESLRIERVMQRSGLTAEEVKARIDSQLRTESSSGSTTPTVDIMNDGLHPVLPQIEHLVATILACSQSR